MRRKLVLFGLSAGMMVTALFHATPAMATDPIGFTSTTIAKGRFAPIDVSSYFISDKGKLWWSSQKTIGKSDGYVLNNVWQPGGSTGWHTHLCHNLIIVTAGAITQYQGGDPTCTGTVYTTGMAFDDEGVVHGHIVRNESTVEAQVVAVRPLTATQ